MKRLRPPAVLALLVALVAFVPIGAQAPAKRAFDLEDILAFRAIGTTTLSTNGQWVAYRLSPLQGDSDVVVRATSGDKEMTFPVGEGAGGAVAFSSDSNWIAITTALTRKEAEAARRTRRPVQNSATIVNLATGDKVSIPKIRRFEFAGETGGWIALHRYGPDTGGAAGAGAAEGGGRGGRGGAAAANPNAPRDTRPRGTDLILRELKTGTEINIGNVSEFAFNKSGKYLALVIDAADQAGNGIQIRDMSAGSVTSLDTDKAFYERLAWTREGDALAALKGKDDKQWRERLFAVVGFTGFGSGTPKRVAYDPTEDKTFPAGMSISGNRAPQWTEARDAITFGIASLTKAPPPAGGRGRGQGDGETAEGAGGRGAGGTTANADDDTNSERPNLMIWHYKDPRLQSMQQVQENADRNLNYVTMYRVQDNKMVRLADEEVPTLTFTGRGRWAIGTTDDP
ncbi:MAG: S9 family peptidase, partial [Acidobacteriota bacterium]